MNTERTITVRKDNETRTFELSEEIEDTQGWQLIGTSGFGPLQTAELTINQVIYLDNWLYAVSKGIGEEAAYAYAENIGTDGAPRDAISAYCGTYDSLEAYAKEYLDDWILEGIRLKILSYFDYAAYGRDLELGGEIWTARVSDGLAIFNS